MSVVRWSAWALAAVFAAGVCYSLLNIPIQVTDSLVPLLQAQKTSSVLDVMLGSADAAAYLRPLRLAQIEILLDASAGHYFAAFKGFHVALVVACFALFVMAAKVRTREDVFAFVFALTVLTGIHTFLGTVWEAYPINHFLEIVVFCLLAFVLMSLESGGWWVDLAAAATFVVASLTIESGLLVWVVIACGRLLGMKGVSRTGFAVVTALLGAYLLARFGWFRTGLPTLIERSTAVGVSRLDPPELTARFGDRVYVLYAYNVACAFLSVLFSEPRAGLWTVPADLAEGRPLLGTLINIGCSTLTTFAIAWCAWSRRRAWRARAFEHDDRIVIVTIAVLIVNAAMSYAYTKDEIMSPAGAFYALAAVAAMRAYAGRVLRSRTIKVRAIDVVVTVLLLAMSSGWALRAIGLHYHMHRIALNVRNEWVIVDEWLIKQNATPTTAEGRALTERLRRDAIDHATANPYMLALQGTVLFR